MLFILFGPESEKDGGEGVRGGGGRVRGVLSPALNLLPLFGVMVYEVFLPAKITFLTWLTLDELFHISLTYLFKS